MTWDKMQLKHRKMLTQNPGTTNFQNWKDPEDHPGLLKASSTYRPAHTGPWGWNKTRPQLDQGERSAEESPASAHILPPMC